MQTRRGGSVLVVASWLALAVPSPRLVNAQVLGSEFQVNSYTTGLQRSSDVAADGLGGFVVVWASVGQDGADYGVFGRRFSPTGTPLGLDFQVNSYTTDRQNYPAVASDGPGNFVVAWSSPHDGSSDGVFAQVYDPAGTPILSNFLVNTYTTGTQFMPSLAANSAGAVVVLWTSDNQDGSSDGVFGRFAPATQPFGPEFQVNTYTTNYQNHAAVAMSSAGEFIVVWQSVNQVGEEGFGIFGQRFNSLGAAVGTEFQINSYTTHNQMGPGVASDGAGNFVVVWHSRYQDGSSWGLFGQRFDAVGVPQGSEFQVNSYTTGLQLAPTVAASAAGDFIVSWISYGQDGSDRGVFGQRFDAAGATLGSEFRVNSYTTNMQYGPSVAADASGNFIVAWDSVDQDGSVRGVYGKRYRALLFGGSFEPGDACDWSAALGGGCP